MTLPNDSATFGPGRGRRPSRRERGVLLAAVTVSPPTGDVEPALIAELEASLAAVVRDAAPAPTSDAELRLAASAVEGGVSLVLTLAPADGSEPKRAERLASRASASAQARAMARELLKPPAKEAPPLAAPSVEAPAPPPAPRPPPRLVLESTAFAGLFLIGEMKKPTGGVDFAIGWAFRESVGVGVRLAASWVTLSHSCYDGDCGPTIDESDLEPEVDPFTGYPEERIFDEPTTTFFTLGFDLSFGRMRIFYADLLVALRCALPTVGTQFMALPIPYLALGFNLTPLRHKRAALLFRLDVGYYTFMWLPTDHSGEFIEPHAAIGIQFQKKKQARSLFRQPFTQTSDSAPVTRSRGKP
jgi:hypothetical protein